MKITRKQLNSYLASELAGLDGIGFNDAWNVAKYGLTREQSSAIRRAISEEYGICKPSSYSLEKINARL